MKDPTKTLGEYLAERAIATLTKAELKRALADFIAGVPAAPAPRMARSAK